MPKRILKSELPPSPHALYQPIREQILSGEIPHNSRIPSIRKLSQMFHLPIRTVAAGIDLLVKSGLVDKRSRSGVYVKPSDSSIRGKTPKAFKADKRKAEHVADHLVSRIASGELPAGRYLPLRKALAFQYKSSFRTINTALAILEQKGLIHPQGSSYVAGLQMDSGPPKGKRVIVFGSKRAAGYYTHGWRDFFPSFEEELGRLGVSISIEERRDSRGKGIADGLIDPNTLGFLFPVSSYWMTNYVAGDPRNLDAELRKLNGLGFPVVMHGCTRILVMDPRQSFHPYRNLFALARNSAASGETLGRYMASMGHSRICFFTYGNHFWNTLRQKGFIRSLQTVWDSRAHLYLFDAQVDAEKLAERFDRISARERTRMDRLVAQLIRGRPLGPVDPTRRTLGVLHGLAQREVLLRNIEPFFEKALKQGDATAWVCADPVLASVAEAYLAKMKIRVPDQLSLACIDDDENTSF